MEDNYVYLDAYVYPSDMQTIMVNDNDGYGGAHQYICFASQGFKDGQAIYSDTEIAVDFVQKLEDGTIYEGLQSEQLAYILRHRAIQLGNKYPHEWTTKMIEGLDMFLQACRDRVESRINRGVMGELKD